MDLSNLPSTIKAFFIILSSIYTFGKCLNIQFTHKKYCLVLLFSFLTTPIMYYVQITIPLYTIFSMTFLVVPFCALFFRQSFSKTLCVTLLSIGSNYAIFALLVVIMIPIISFLVFINTPSLFTETISLFLIGILQNVLLLLLFRTKRLHTGIPEIINAFEGNTGIFTGTLVILISSCFYLNENIRNPAFHFLLISFILALGIIIWLWWKKSIHTDYIFQSHTRRIDMLEDTLREKEAELDRLSKIIHKDNKLLAALEHSTRELLSAAPSDTAERLLQELNRFSEERRDTLSAYEAKQLPFPETSFFSIDTMLRYLQQRAQKYAIDFQVHFDENISSITDVITEQDLCTLIADLGENAIIATKSAEIKNILLSIEKKDSKKYTLNFFDSGEPFPEEVLAHLGKKRYTTHAATGGSGIGLMTTSELAQKYQAEFHISSTELSPPYTKCISLTFPHSLREL